MGFKISIQFGGESEEEKIYKECIKLIDEVSLIKEDSKRFELLRLIRAKMKRLPAEKCIKLKDYAKDLGVGL